MSVSRKLPSVAIIGAGIGGLTLYSALRQNKGFKKVKVFDQAAAFSPTSGAGFGLSPNGQMCLKSIGINCQEILHPFHSMVRLDKRGNVKVSSNVFENIMRKYGFGISGCLRADLIQTLSEKAGDDLKYSHKLINIEDDTRSVKVSFENGYKDHFDVVIGSDGINSTVAEKLNIDKSPPVYSNANIFYGVIPDPDHIGFCNPVLKDSNHKVIQGTGTGEFIMFNCGPKDRQVLVWANTYVSNCAPNRNDEWARVGETNADLSNVLKRYPSEHPIHEVALLTDPQRLLHFGLHYRKHKYTWSNNSRVTLMGDACHATLPYVGQGANQAIEDAIVLAKSLESLPHDQAFKNFYQERFKRTKRIVQMAGALDKLYHSNNVFTRGALDLLLTSVAKGGFVFKQLEKEIVEECPVDYKLFQTEK